MVAGHGGGDAVNYLLRRLAFALFLVFAVSSGSFVLTRLAKGDYVTETLGIAALLKLVLLKTLIEHKFDGGSHNDTTNYS